MKELGCPEILTQLKEVLIYVDEGICSTGKDPDNTYYLELQFACKTTGYS